MAAFTLEQYNAICAAIGSGELVVRYNGKQIEYRSIDELTRAKAVIEADLIAAGLLQPPASAGGLYRGGTTHASVEWE